MSPLPKKIKFVRKAYHRVGTCMQYRMAFYTVYKVEGLHAFAKLIKG